VDALDSLEAQTFRNWEAIVIWDREDDVPEFYTKAYPYVRWFGLGENVGAGAARNIAVEKARAPFIVFLDADDWLYPQALEQMLKAWDDEDAIVYTDYVGKSVIDNPKRLAPDLQEKLYSYDKKTGDAIIGYRSANYNCGEAQKQPVEKGYPFIWSLVTALIPKLWHDEIGGFDEDMHSWEDADYHWRMARAGKCYTRIPQELLVVRFRTGTRRDLGLQDHRALIEYLTDKYKEIPPVGCNCGNKKVAQISRTQATPQRVGNSTPAIASRTLNQEANMSDQDFVMVKYIHPNKGKHKVVGVATRTNYGRRGGGEEFLVHVADVAAQAHLFIELDTRIPPEPSKITPAPQRVRGLLERYPVDVLLEDADEKEDDRGLTRSEIINEFGERLGRKVLDAGYSSITRLQTASEEQLIEQGLSEIEVALIIERIGIVHEERPFELQLLPGVTEAIEKEMVKSGLDSVEAVTDAGIEGLKAIKGIGDAKAEAIIAFATKLLANKA
jgi:hypothetical protein